MWSYVLLAPVLAVAAASYYIGNFVHAIPDRNEDFNVFLMLL